MTPALALKGLEANSADIVRKLCPQIGYIVETDKFDVRHDRSKRQAVSDLVLDSRRIGRVLYEPMPMYPLSIRAAKLRIDKFMWRIPKRDLSTPLHRQSVQTQLIVDQRSLPHLDRLRRQDVKAKLGRSNSFKVRCVGKKGEDLVSRTFDRKLACQDVFGPGSKCGQTPP